jgi:hypothetical protein
VELMNIPTDPDGQVLNIDFYPRRRVNCVGPARLLLNVDDATKLAQFLGEAVESRLRWQKSSTESWCASAGIEVRRASKKRDTKSLTRW